MFDCVVMMAESTHVIACAVLEHCRSLINYPLLLKNTVVRKTAT